MDQEEEQVLKFAIWSLVFVILSYAQVAYVVAVSRRAWDIFLDMPH
jgi:hypothetical protein